MILPNLAVRRPVTTSMFFAAFAILGVVSWTRLPIQLFPELIFPEVFVTLTLQGASPEQVERDLLIPVEGEIGKLDGIQEMESFAMANRGGIRISFAADVDMKFALLQLQSNLNRLQATLPERTQTDVRRFDSTDLSSSIMELHVLADWDLNQLREFTEEKIRPELESVDGVVNVSVLGGRRSAVEIVLDPFMLEAHGLSAGQVRTRLNSHNRRREYLGRVYDGNRAYSVSVQGQFTDLRQIRDLVLDEDSTLRLGDVSRIEHGLQDQADRHRVNGKPSVGVRIQKDDEANLIEVAAAVEGAIERLNRNFSSEGVELGVSSSQADLMAGALSTLKQAAIVGAVLGLIVLFLFLRNLRFVSVLLLAIPVSLLMTFNLMYLGGLSVNVLSLCGLALAMGMLADNGIVVMENIFKHYERGKSPSRAAREGASEVGRAVVAATATTVTAFLPVLFIESDARDLLRELALSMAFPLMASLLVALTLVPALAVRALSREVRQPPDVRGLLERYTLLLKAALRHRASVVLSVGGALALTLVLAFFYLLQQQVRREETRFTVYVNLPEGATLDATDEVVKQVEESVRDVPGLDRFTTSIREAEADVSVLLLNRSDRPGGISLDEIKEQLDEKLQNVQGGVVGYEPRPRAGRGGRGQGIGQGRRRSSGGFDLTGTTPNEQVVVRGYDFTVLTMIANDVSFRLEELEEVDANSVRADAERSSPEVQVIPDAAALFDRRLGAQEVLAAMGDTRWDGFRTTVPFLLPDATEIPIEVRTIEEEDRDRYGLAEFRRSRILNQDGHFVPLDEVARVRTDEGRSSLLRTDQARRLVVSYRFPSEVLDSQPRLELARRVVRATLQDMALPEGYSIEIIEAQEEIIYYWMMAIAALLIYMILASLFESLASPIIILCTLPPAAVGSCWALMMSGMGLSQQEGPMALLGFIVLLGIAVNNGIILIDAVGVLRSKFGFRRERAVLAAARSRVRPILMTTATTLLGVLPLALEFGGDFEIWPPFAITVLGGLSVSMVSTLILIPVVYMGLDQIGDWLADMGFAGVTLSLLATAASGYGIFVRYESIFWASLSIIPIWGAFLTVVWIAQKVHRSRVAARRVSSAVHSIELRNLTKIYGASGRFMREWARDDRRRGRLMRTGLDPQDRKAVRDALYWKLPLLALLSAFATYFEDEIWIYLHALALAFMVTHVGRCLGDLRQWHLPAPYARVVRLLHRAVLPLAFIAYVHWRLDLLSVTLATFGLWAGYRTARWLADRVRTGEIDPDALPGRFARPRRWFYRMASALPIIGVPRPEFRALAGVNLEIGRGMFGLLGPNGAGKTTLMRILCRVLEPSYGSILIDGRNILNKGSIHGLIGYLPQHFGNYGHLSAYEFLEYRALLEGFKDRTIRENRVIESLDQVNLIERKDDPIGSFSGGMKQRLGIAQTLLHAPLIVVVDEPTAGLDPLERIRFRNLLARLSQDRIVIFSTHIVEDISGSCNRLAVLDQGRLVYTGTPEEMRNLATGRVWDAVVSDGRFSEMEEKLKLVSHQRTPDGVRMRFLSERAPVGIGAQRADPTLEDAYLYLLGRGEGQPC